MASHCDSTRWLWLPTVTHQGESGYPLWLTRVTVATNCLTRVTVATHCDSPGWLWLPIVSPGWLWLPTVTHLGDCGYPLWLDWVIVATHWDSPGWLWLPTVSPGWMWLPIATQLGDCGYPPWLTRVTVAPHHLTRVTVATHCDSPGWLWLLTVLRLRNNWCLVLTKILSKACLPSQQLRKLGTNRCCSNGGYTTCTSGHITLPSENIQGHVSK